MQLVDEENHLSNHNSFLDQEINIESINFSNDQKNTEISLILPKVSQKEIPNIPNLFTDETGRFPDQSSTPKSLSGHQCNQALKIEKPDSLESSNPKIFEISEKAQHLLISEVIQNEDMREGNPPPQNLRKSKISQNPLKSKWTPTLNPTNLEKVQKDTTFSKDEPISEVSH